jgi:hypothetical protein
MASYTARLDRLQKAVAAGFGLLVRDHAETDAQSGIASKTLFLRASRPAPGKSLLSVRKTFKFSEER